MDLSHGNLHNPIKDVDKDAGSAISHVSCNTFSNCYWVFVQFLRHTWRMLLTPTIIQFIKISRVVACYNGVPYDDRWREVVKLYYSIDCHLMMMTIIYMQQASCCFLLAQFSLRAICQSKNASLIALSSSMLFVSAPTIDFSSRRLPKKMHRRGARCET